MKKFLYLFLILQTFTLADNLDGYIKGVVVSIQESGSKNSWLYSVKGIDTTNAKLSKAIFSSSNKLEKDDLIYAKIENGVATEIYMIKKENRVVRPKTVVKSSAQASSLKEVKFNKRTKDRQKIAPPSSETLSLE